MNEHPDRKAFQMEDVRELRDKVDEYQTLLKEHGDEMSDSDRVLIKTLAERQTALADSLERCAKGEDEVSVMKAQTEVMRSIIDPVLEGNDPLLPFDLDALSEDDMGFFMGRKNVFLKHGNAFALIEIFYRLVLKCQMSPPAWVMENLAEGFEEYIFEGEGDPTALARALNLMGKASGTTPPHQEWQRQWGFRGPVIEMHVLIESFGLKKAPAAEAVKLKHGLSESVSTLKRYYDDNFAGLEGIAISFVDNDDEYQRTKFLTSFPPAALKIIRKKKRSR